VTFPLNCLIGLALLAGFLDDVGLAPLLLTCLVLVFAGLIALASWKRDLFIRLVLWLPAHVFYRIRIFGLDNVPRQGQVLFVSNHVSWIDALLLYWAQPRAVRFLVWAPFTRVPGIRLILRFSRAIPVDSGAGPRAIIQSMREAAEALARGDAVCIFAEGGITRTGFLLPFHRGLEQILKRTPAPVVPVCLDHVWGSIFSYRGGRPFWKWPQKLPYPVFISFGAPLPGTVSAFEVRQAIQRLSADSSIARADQRRPIHRQFVYMAARHPFRSCIIDTMGQGRVLRYGHVLAGAQILGRRLKPMLTNESIVGLWLPPSAAGALANIALSFLGKVPVNLNYTSSSPLVQSAIEQCGIRHVLTSRLFTAKVPLQVSGVVPVYLEEFRKDLSAWERWRTFLTIVILPGIVLDRWILGLAKHRLDDLATIIFSSGSTGDPKGVMLSHRNLAANAESVIQAIDPGPLDRLLGILPFFHSFGFTVTLWVPLQVGASLVYHADPRQGKEVGELCRKYRCTILLTTPTFLRICLKRCQPEDFANVRVLMCGAEKLPQSLAKEFKDKFGVQPLEGYGCTELSPVAAANVPDWQKGSVRQIGNKPGSIGQPVPGVAAKIVDPETFQPLPAGKEGLLLVYGANVLQGYLGRPEATRDAIHDGWYVTGDIAKIDEDGFITLTDRLSRFSKIGGEMVPHQKIEDELHSILKTNERLCVVTAVPDERRGERLIVLHTALNGVDHFQLSQQLGKRGLPNLWVPAPNDFLQIGELPILGSGKVDLRRAREIALENSKR
jgi:acyl-[acyl-carrier-protein]-phospholipid O-acyltransferase/long-chain-fatty-acid--[acyl-carrier-protein] ligase